MKKTYLVCLALLMPGCASITGDQWRWMDEPSMQRWVDIRVEGWGGEVQFAVPERLNGSSNRTRAQPALGRGDATVHISASLDEAFPRADLATFNWDYWWGGFFRDEGVDFFLSVKFIGYKEAEGFLRASPDSWIEWRKEYWKEKYPDPHKEENIFARVFLEGYEIDQFVSDQSLIWVFENRPHLQPKLEVYMTPVSDNQVLMFSFFVNENSRNGLEADPAWAARRWEMARKILNTVEITPRPGKF